MSNPVLFDMKLNRPELPAGYIPRQRLEARLEEACAKDFVLVSGSASIRPAPGERLRISIGTHGSRIFPESPSISPGLVLKWSAAPWNERRRNATLRGTYPCADSGNTTGKAACSGTASFP